MEPPNTDAGQPTGSAPEDAAEPPARVRPASPPPFSVLRTRWLLPWVVLGTLILYGVLHLLAGVTPLDLADEGTADIAAMMAGYGAVAAWIALVCWRSGVRLGRLAPPLPAGHRWLPIAGLLVCLMLFSYGSFVVLASWIATFAPGVIEFLIRSLESVSDPSPGYRLAMGVVVVAVAPVMEEVLFRGVLLNRWAAKWGTGVALVLTSAVFGLLHANPIGIGVVGLVAGLLYLKTGTLLVPIALHAANNLIATAADQLLGGSEPMDVAAEVAALPGELPVGIAMVAVSVPVLVVFIRRHWPARGSPIPYDGATARQPDGATAREPEAAALP